MPFYNYNCLDCGDNFKKLLPFSQSANPQTCTTCASVNTQKGVTMPQVMFKGDGWADKNARIKQQMKRKNTRLAKKENQMKRDAPNVTLAPNVEGERVATWDEAAKLAKARGKDTTLYEKKAYESKKT